MEGTTFHGVSLLIPTYFSKKKAINPRRGERCRGGGRKQKGPSSAGWGGRRAQRSFLTAAAAEGFSLK